MGTCAKGGESMITMTVRQVLIGFIVANSVILAITVSYLVYDIVTSIRAWKQKRKETTGKEEQ